MFLGRSQFALAEQFTQGEGEHRTGSALHDHEGIYLDTTTGWLYYNPTGSVQSDSVPFAILDPATARSWNPGHEDFILFD